MEYLLHKTVYCTWEEENTLEPVFPNFVKDYTLKCNNTNNVISIKVEHDLDASYPMNAHKMVSNQTDNVEEAHDAVTAANFKENCQPSSSLANSVPHSEIIQESYKYHFTREYLHRSGLKHQLIKYATPKLSQVSNHVIDNVRKYLDQKRNVCPAPHCGLRFSESADLKSHVLTDQSREISHSCPHCSFSSFQSSDFKAHMQTHVGTAGRPYACNKCEATFLKGIVLKNHIKFVHDGVKLHICDTCGRRFSYLHGLMSHIRSHTGESPFKCQECGKSYRSKGGLQMHTLIHKGIKKFSCEMCGMSFTQKPMLIQHIRIHTGEKPFNCHDCGKTFAQLSSLNFHKKSCTKKKED